MKRRQFTLAAVVALSVTLALAGISSPATASHLDDPPSRSTPIDDPIPGHIEDGAVQVELETLTEGAGLTAPNWGTFAPGHPGVLFVVDQDGPLWAIDTSTGRKNRYLDTRRLLVPLGVGGPGTFDERGFLGAAFSPDFLSTGLLYTLTSEPIPGTDGSAQIQPNHYGTLREWRVPDPSADPLAAAAPATSRIVLRVREPQFNHNGGAIFFGTKADDRRLLYVTLGDGGCADDQNGQQGLAGEGPCISHTGPGNAQKLDNLLGKILRIDPQASGDAPYTVPAGNPFVGVAGARPEIYAYGFRNPFRASSDRADLGGTGAVWTADVGQNHLEEVDARVQPGGNYGWRVKEGTFRFNPSGKRLIGLASDGFVFANAPGRPAGLVDPVAQYDHDEGVATIGGFVYRGSRLPELRGRYLFGDYSDGFTSGNGRVMYVAEGDRVDPHERTPKVFNAVNGHINLFVLGLGEDTRGELYVLANKDGVPFGEEGVVMKVVRRCADGTDCRD